jgi:hypothetical protein
VAAPNEEIPSFASPHLSGLARAFSRRGKAIRYHSKSFKVLSERDVTGDEPLERLNADICLISPHNTKLRLSLWPDGAMWLWAGQSSKSGWAFQVTVEGVLSAATPTGIVDAFEESIGIVSQPQEAAAIEARLRKLWARMS